MRLLALAPTFVIHDPVSPYSLKYTSDIARAHGVMFLCPKCFRLHDGMLGTHMIICWRPLVPGIVPPGPGRWEMKGTGYADLTLEPSVSQGSGCGACFNIRDGEVIEVFK
jgi:hypothetical protein